MAHPHTSRPLAHTPTPPRTSRRLARPATRTAPHHQRGCFLYGNHLEALADQVENVAYARFCALHSAHMDVAGSVFTAGLMRARDGKGESRDGSGRVGIFELTGIPMCYTLECNYNTGKVVNAVSAAPGKRGRSDGGGDRACVVDKNDLRGLPPRGPCASHRRSRSPPQIPDASWARVPGDGTGGGSAATARPPSPGHAATAPPPYTPSTWGEVGRGLLLAFLDQRGANPWSRVPASPYHTHAAVRTAVEKALRAER